MKQLVLFSLIIGLIFSFSACNTPDPNTDVGDLSDLLYVWGTLDEMTNTITPGETWLDLFEASGDYPGRSLVLADCDNVYAVDRTKEDNPYSKPAPGLQDIQKYGQIILTVLLYKDEAGTIPVAGENYAQFCILKGTGGDWDDTRKITDDAYGVSSNTPKGTTPKVSASGIPTELLVQGNYTAAAKTSDSVVRVKVVSLEFKLRSDLPVFSVEYSTGGGGVTVTNGNEINFNNMKFGDGAVVFGFPADWPQTTALDGKKMAFDYTISGITTAVPANATRIQINIQAANKEENKTNDKHDDTGLHGGKGGQKYVMLDNPADGDSTAYGLTWTPTGDPISSTGDGSLSNGNGSFKIPFNELLTAASAGLGDDGSFDLTAIRIENNGDMYDSVYKQKTYTLTFTSIRVED